MNREPQKYFEKNAWFTIRRGKIINGQVPSLKDSMSEGQPSGASWQALMTLHQGHSAGNDFAFLTDVNAKLLSPRAGSPRLHSTLGIGADGFIRAARSTASRGSEAARGAPGRCLVHGLPAAVTSSIAEMCGNGVRTRSWVPAHRGLIELEVGETVKVVPCRCEDCGAHRRGLRDRYGFRGLHSR